MMGKIICNKHLSSDLRKSKLRLVKIWPPTREPIGEPSQPIRVWKLSPTARIRSHSLRGSLLPRRRRKGRKSTERILLRERKREKRPRWRARPWAMEDASHPASQPSNRVLFLLSLVSLFGKMPVKVYYIGRTRRRGKGEAPI